MRRYSSVPFSDVAITGAFWSERLEVVLTRTIPSQHKKLGEYGLLDSLKLPNPPPPLRKLSFANTQFDGGPGRPVGEGGVGYSCIAEQRMIETIQSGKPSTSFLKHGDRVEIEVRNAKNHSIFGRIEQEVVKT